MRLTLTLVLIFILVKTVCAQTAISDTLLQQPLTALDSAAQLKQQQYADSLARFFIAPPDPARKNQFMDSVLKANLYTGYAFLDLHYKPVKTKVQEGKTRNLRNGWMLAVMLGLLLYTALLNRFLNKAISDIIQSFYNKRILSQFSKEENLINSWSFILLFLLFGATVGLLFYQVLSYYNRSYTDNGWQLYLGFTFAVIIFFILKIIVLRVLGLIFNIRSLVKEYISVLYLTYFNVTFISLPLVVCFGLIADSLKPIVLLVFGLLIIFILFWQYIRSSINILSIYRFSKVYLFIYLCALEFCPVLILIKALKL
ncbi:DUF4271 domain-containing protein [Mucilaginibacter arboris]|uniref:DUF4271 domain-containing protein n=1 Tax=Mucilaginibacter arboris TaxID=2682090 RepID=A0A7K1SSK9_9SPHI|nr:DUF4271 domain-containing protein [Mucilaginibacter arboris]MVN20299.1 DUF4271 domain-containing protein [Mucilaginibacter arboris]